jgi:hypothetical protein
MAKRKRDQKPKSAGGSRIQPNDAVVGKSNNPKSRVGSKQEKVRGLLRHHGGLLGRRRLYARPHRTCRSEHQHGTWPYGPICQDGEQSLCLTYPRLRLSMKAGSAKAVHCAICTRVSTDQGLEQDFNSLDAQHDASLAYIRSQAHAGWTLLRGKYDDGGFSGGNTDRPALQRLLEDVRAGKIDAIVVYKVDRLTRSLALTLRSNR